MHYPELTLRTEPAHREAFVALPVGPDGIPPVHFELAVESLRAWAQEQGIEDERLTLKPQTSACAPPISRPDPSPRRVSPTTTATSPSRSRKAMIEAHDLVKRYGSTMAVNDLSFSVRPGMVTGFLGPNGAGKPVTGLRRSSLAH